MMMGLLSNPAHRPWLAATFALLLILGVLVLVLA